MFVEPSDRGFGDFVASKDPNEVYVWELCTVCACGQYAQSISFDNWMGKVARCDPGSDMWSKWNNIAAVTPRTFGALHQRLKEAELV